MMIYNLTFFTNRVFHHPYLPPATIFLVSISRKSVNIYSIEWRRGQNLWEYLLGFFQSTQFGILVGNVD